MYLVLDPTTGRETSSGGVGGVCAGKMLTLARVLRNGGYLFARTHLVVVLDLGFDEKRLLRLLTFLLDQNVRLGLDVVHRVRIEICGHYTKTIHFPFD